MGQACGPDPAVSAPVNVGGYIEAVLDRNLAENISRVLYPNDNVSRSRAWSGSLLHPSRLAQHTARPGCSESLCLQASGLGETM